MQRISTLNPDGTTAMPTKLSRAKKWVNAGKARWVKTKLRVKAVQLLFEPSGRKTQSIVIGIDPGKVYSGIGVQSSKATLFLAHLLLPFKRVKERMESRKMMRRGRRGRRINRSLSFNLRAHRQKRFSNRTQKKIAPSIRANRQLEIRIVSELSRLFPVTEIVYEYVKADVNLTSGRKSARSGAGFSAVMVGQRWAINQLSKIAPVRTLFGWQTAQIRTHLGLLKSKNKSEQSPQSHAVDGVALAASRFVQYQSFEGLKEHGYQWVGSVQLTYAKFVVIARPPYSRRQLHLMVPTKGGVRRKYGGSLTRHHFKKGDLVKITTAVTPIFGYVSGDTESKISVSDFKWSRIGRFAASRAQLLRRNTGLLVDLPRNSSVCIIPSPNI
jgi:RRXRR protein